MKDYYKILELPFGASSLEIKRAYYKLAFKYHPDKNFGKPLFEAIFKEINEAYTVLSDENRRIIYHGEYNDYINGYTIVQKPVVPVYKDPRYTPPQPRGPATRITVEYKELKIAIAIMFVVLILSMLYASRGHMTEQVEPDANAYIPNGPTVTTHLTKDEYYQVISREFMDSHDSTLLKMDVDSLLRVMDSIMQAQKK